MTPLTSRRLKRFRANKRSWFALWIFLALFFLTLFAEVIANDKPIIMRYDGHTLFPIFHSYTDRFFGGDFDTEADFRDPFIIGKINKSGGWMLFPPIRFGPSTINYNILTPHPSPPNGANWLGTDDQGRDVLARLIYGYRISVLFGLCLTVASAVLGIAAGAVQGFFGGLTDLIFQRVIEIWSGLPRLFVLIILASMVEPNFWWLLGILLLFSWTSLTGLVRAEFLRGRNFDYVRAARALGVSEWRILWRHVLPNALVASTTMLPFVMSASVTALTMLDFLGLGMPVGTPSLGELLLQGKGNPEAPWLGFTGFIVIAGLLVLIVFIAEGVRDCMDPRKVMAE